MSCVVRSSGYNWWWWRRYYTGFAAPVQVNDSCWCRSCSANSLRKLTRITAANAKLLWKKWWTCLRGTQAVNVCKNRFPKYELSGWGNNAFWGRTLFPDASCKQVFRVFLGPIDDTNSIYSSSSRPLFLKASNQCQRFFSTFDDRHDYFDIIFW